MLPRMTVTLRSPMTLEQFLQWEERQELRYEFDGERPVAMVGGTYAHAVIQANLLAALGARLRGTPCRAVGSDLKLRAAGRIRYPDAMIICAPRANAATVETTPTVVFEILSDGTAETDLGPKQAEYRANAAIGRYVVLQQRSIAATAFVRDGNEWREEPIEGDAAILRLPEAGIAVPLAECYADLDLHNAAPTA
jgi:Uma2 family endonuclease